MSDTQQYQVLARKYRPTNFDDLVGQQALVRTLTNALKVGRIASAFVLTGVRGVGKTTTARIVAKALNCDKTDANGNPPIKPCGECTHCRTIAVGTHMDVMEMDAASHTSIDDIRDIIDSAQYKPVTARYKVFILDEVHMLSKSAFNGLLKILEEPPAHVKFILATTDIDKVPVTVLSRCQRFDLRRITVQDLIALYTDISKKEGFEVSDDAMRTIAVAADGSARDGLSILDQALALTTDGKVHMDLVVSMLGLADKQAIYDVFKSLMQGDITAVVTQVDTLYNAGADPTAVLQALLDVNWLLTRYKHTPTIVDALSLSEIERNACVDMAQALDIPTLTRTWQVLQKGVHECAQTDRPIMALEMVLIRVAYMASVPSVEKVIKSVLQTGQNTTAPKNITAPNSMVTNTTTTVQQVTAPEALPAKTPPVPSTLAPPPAQSLSQPSTVAEPPAQQSSAPAQSPSVAPPPPQQAPPENFDAWVQVVRDKQPIIGNTLWRQAGLVSYTPPKVCCAMQGVSSADIQKIRSAIKTLFGADWHLDIVPSGGQQSLQQQAQDAHQQVLQQVEQLPEIQAIKRAFPNAVLTEVEADNEQGDNDV